MLEIHLHVEKRRSSLPVGPGPQEIIKGNETAGYFGEVPASQIYTSSGLASALGITQGVVMNENTVWLKFAHNGRVKYMPKTVIRNSCSWQHLLDKGCAFHRDDPSSALLSPGITWVPQDKILNHLDGYQFDVHLPSTTPIAYHNNPNGTNTIIAGSEWYDLLLRSCINYPGPAGDRWANNDQATLMGGGQYTWSREAYTGQLSWRLCPIGITTQIGGYGYTYDERNIISWRPVLELLPQ